MTRGIHGNNSNVPPEQVFTLGKKNTIKYIYDSQITSIRIFANGLDTKIYLLYFDIRLLRLQKGVPLQPARRNDAAESTAMSPGS